MQNSSQDVYDATGKGTYDAMGNSPMFAKPVATGGITQPKKAEYAAKPTTSGETMQEEEPKNESVKFDVTDYINVIFEGQQLSDEFKQKAAVVFEAALNEKVAIIEQAILQASEEVIEEQVVQAVNVLTEKVDGYLGYVINEWMDENKLQVEQGFRTEIAENFMAQLKQLFENSYIHVPAEKIDLVDELFAENRQLEENLHALMKKNLELQEKSLVNECANVFMELSSDLADTQVEKLASLTEGIEFDSVEQYKEKVQILKESYFNSKTESKNTETLNESVSTSAPMVNDDMMSHYVSAISKHLKSVNVKR